MLQVSICKQRESSNASNRFDNASGELQSFSSVDVLASLLLVCLCKVHGNAEMPLLPVHLRAMSAFLFRLVTAGGVVTSSELAWWRGCSDSFSDASFSSASSLRVLLAVLIGAVVAKIVVVAAGSRVLSCRRYKINSI